MRIELFSVKLHDMIEIDGKCHKERADEDRLRDKDFSGIGIRTIRIFAKYVTKRKFWPTLKEKFEHPKKSLKKKKAKKAWETRRRRIVDGQIAI